MSDERIAQALPEDHPMMVAWKSFCETDEFKNALHWAMVIVYDDGRPIEPFFREQYVKGALWLAFTKGMEVGLIRK